MTTQDNFQFKILIVGESSVGKSCLMNRFVDETFSNTFSPTIGVDFKIRTIMIDNYQCKIQIQDTAGQERYHAITRTYYRDAAGVLIVYDVNNAETFSSIRRWMDDIRQSCQENIIRILVGNKDDGDSIKKEVSTETAEEYAEQLKIPFFQTSAKINKNVQEIFHTITRLALEQRLNNQKKTKSIKTIQLNQPEKNKRSCCK